ncbi:MAG: hypothetical protein LAT82_04380 [Nanoarchaeota archaeon]|nr:hypothetical protein [Nanoarchaeota archaeon]
MKLFKYFEDEILLTQEVVKEIIIILENKEELVDQLFDFDLNSFEDLINSIFTVIYIKLTKLKNEFVNETKLSQGLTTATLFYCAIFLISKGLQKKGYKIDNNFYKLIPYSSQENLEINRKILGIEKNKKFFFKDSSFTLSLDISLLTNSMFIFGGDKTRRVGCPYTQNNSGKKLNQDLSIIFLQFLDLLYNKILKNKEQQYEETPLNRSPDFINVLLGRFEINEEHLQNYPQYFTKL